MHSRKLIGTLALLSACSLSGCVSMWNDDGNQGTQSVFADRGVRQTKPDRQWRQDIGAEWDERERALSRLRLREFID
jgi:hypothetical protein